MTNNILDSTKFLSPAEDAALAKKLDGWKHRNTFMIWLLRKYGMRAGELVSIRVRDLNLESRTMLIPGKKGSRSREVPLSEETCQRLRQIVEFLHEDNRVFPLSVRTLQRIWHGQRPCKKRIHCLRHTCAINLYQKTKDIQVVQKLLGHKSLANTMIYQEFIYTQDALRKALDVL